jgi:hypothetical protein
MGKQETSLQAIPVFDVGQDWPFETLDRGFARVNALLDEGSRLVPRSAIAIADNISRRWLERWHEPYLAEIDRIAARLGRPGAYFFNVSYEWGCTSSAGPGVEGTSARLMRVLDWPNRGLGRHVIAARVDGAAGPWLTLTWPGYTGVLQAVAPGRFAAALNQAPMDKPVGLYPLDWLVNRLQVWNRPHLTPAHLLRRVFEGAPDFAAAKRMLIETPLALPTIYILAGLKPDEACVVERMPERAHVIDGPAAAANAWQAPDWTGRPRGEKNDERRECMGAFRCSLDDGFPWLRPPVLNRWTRLVFAADASRGEALAQGYEADGPATAVLRWCAASQADVTQGMVFSRE